MSRTQVTTGDKYLLRSPTLETHSHRELVVQLVALGHAEHNVVLALPAIGDLQTWLIYVDKIKQERGILVSWNKERGR